MEMVNLKLSMLKEMIEIKPQISSIGYRDKKRQT